MCFIPISCAITAAFGPNYSATMMFTPSSTNVCTLLTPAPDAASYPGFLSSSPLLSDFLHLMLLLLNFSLIDPFLNFLWQEF
jgi:hypothetical protein